MQVSTIGVDLAKNVFQVHGVARASSTHDPGCVKTPRCCYDSPVILWGN
jgi:hypothetical protein